MKTEDPEKSSGAGAEAAGKVRWLGPEGGPIVAKIHGPDGSAYLVSKDRVVIGRESTHNESDVVVQENNYVSRGHLVLRRRADGQWLVQCNGKNGVFVDSTLVKRSDSPVPVPKRCMMRFPSTSVRLVFQSFDENETEAQALTSPTGNSTKQYPVSLGDSGFVSPSDVSPSAVNSCPASPRSFKRSLDGAPVENGKSDGDADDAAMMKMIDGEGDVVESADGKPPFSYAQLIIQAIASTSERQMTLSGIYGFITRNYPWYRTCDKGWQNSIRHNLSLNRYFVKVPRNQEEPGKGSFWRIEESSEPKLLQFAYRKRRPRTSRIRSAPVSPSPSTAETTQNGEELIDVLTYEPKSSTLASHDTKLEVKTQVEPEINGDHGMSAETSADTPRGQSLEKKRVFTFSPVMDPASGRLVSQSAPCSPKGFGLVGKEAHKREHHHSGGSTFRVRTGAKDGRHRLQLCHTPPEYIPVTRSDVSALHQLTAGGSRKANVLQKYRGGSKSLSTTPVREILAVGGPQKIREDAERIAKALVDGPPEPKVLKRRHENGELNIRPSTIVEAPSLSSMLPPATGLVLVTRPVALAPGLGLSYSQATAYLPQLLPAAALYPGAVSAGLLPEAYGSPFPLCHAHAAVDPRLLADVNLVGASPAKASKLE